MTKNIKQALNQKYIANKPTKNIKRKKNVKGVDLTLSIITTQKWDKRKLFEVMNMFYYIDYVDNRCMHLSKLIELSTLNICLFLCISEAFFFKSTARVPVTEILI